MKRSLDEYVTAAKKSKLEIVPASEMSFILFQRAFSFTHLEKNGYENLVNQHYQRKLNELFEKNFLKKEFASTKLVEEDWMSEIAEIKAENLSKRNFQECVEIS